MTFGRTVWAGLLVLIIYAALSRVVGFFPFHPKKPSPTVSAPGPPRLEINPSPANIEVGCGLKIDEKGREIPLWQFQTSITVTRPASISTGKVFIRTCFFTGRKDNWTSKISDWTPSCLADPFVLTELDIKAMTSKRCQTHNVQPYQTVTGPLKRYRVAHGIEIAAKEECKSERVWRFKPGDPLKYEHLVYPDLADNPWSYLRDDNARAILFVKVILEDQTGHQYDPLIRYYPIQSVTDYRGPGPELFQWADDFLEKPPQGVDPPKGCVLPVPKPKSQ